MRKIFVMMSVSLDGFIARADGSLDWHRVTPELHQHFNDVLRPTSVFLDGRTMHELMATYWPTADDDPKAPTEVAEFAVIWRDKPKLVFSKTLPPGEIAHHSRVVSEVVPDEIRKLQAEAGGDMCLGGADLAATFFRHDLVDELRLFVHPVVLGRGKPLWLPSDMQHTFRLLNTRTFERGVVQLHYARETR